ncbi:MAG TPA: hypothetical protein VMR52_01450 [Dehalococcoidia bacterium]|nr:hypothetical protein [Dehalococcoidia bacterium]
MKVEFEPEEVRELLAFICDALIDEAGLAEKDRGLLRKWRIDSGKAGQLSDLTETVNADIAQTLVNKKKGAVRKPDWR